MTTSHRKICENVYTQKIRRHALLLIQTRLPWAIDDKMGRTPSAVALLMRPRSLSPVTFKAAPEMF